MIRVERGPEPDGFSEDAAEWLQQFQIEKKTNQITASRFWSRVRQRSAMQLYVQQLYKAFHYKCAFCESRPKSLQIEHYRPKGKQEFEPLIFNWENWLAACAECNRNKGTRFPDCNGEPCLVNPSSEDPTAHIEFLREHILGKTERGEKTIELIGLDGSPHTDERASWLSTVEKALLLCLVPEAREVARRFIIWAMQPDAPYSAMTRRYLRERAPGLTDPVIPHPHVEFEEPLKQIAELVEKYKNQLARLY